MLRILPAKVTGPVLPGRAWAKQGLRLGCTLGFMLALVLAPAAGFAQKAALAAAPRPPVNTVPVATMNQLGKALFACWAPPPGTAGSEITFRFGLTAKGELRGKPLATYSVLTGSQDSQRAFVAAAILALSRCTPVLMTDPFARIAASRVLTLRFVSGESRA